MRNDTPEMTDGINEQLKEFCKTLIIIGNIPEDTAQQDEIGMETWASLLIEAKLSRRTISGCHVKLTGSVSLS